ncbi:MAG: scramblase [Actinobacteria bacterium]|nr:scramblase [Actinomycetota bacterium]
MALLDYHRIVINQKAKLIELTNEYRIRDEQGSDIGVIRQEGQSGLKKVARFVTSLDQFMTHRLAAYDASGTRVLELVRPRKIVKSSVEVYDGVGALAGTIRQQNVFGKIRFGLHDAAGRRLGEIRAENWRAWNFAIVNEQGTEVGRITKTWEGLAKTLFTTADDYLLDISPTLTGPLRLLAFASAVGVDTALKQDARGLG